LFFRNSSDEIKGSEFIFRILVVKPLKDKPIERHGHISENNIKLHVIGNGIYTGRGQDPGMGFCEHGDEPSTSIRVDVFLE
jgi:hypothetical protein